MKTHVVQLENHDDLASVQDKVSWSKAPRILLVWPKRGRVLGQRLELLLVMRFCRRMGAQLALVSSRLDIREYAADLGVPLFQEVDEAQQQSWRRLRPRRRSSVFASRTPRVVDLHTLQQQMPRKPWMTKQPGLLLRAVVFSVAVAAMLAISSFFLPEAQVTLAMAAETQSLTLEVWAAPGIGSPNLSGGLPAQSRTIVVEGEDQILSSGSILLSDQYATGEVVFTNMTTEDVEVMQGGVVATLAQPAARYLITGDGLVVPAGVGNTARAAVRAVLPGSGGNVEAGEIRAVEGDIGLRISVNNPEAVSGGGEQISPAPTEMDYSHLRQNLLEKLRLSAIEQAQRELAAGEQLLPDTVVVDSVLSERREPDEGQPGDRLTLKMQIKFTAWVVEGEDVETVARSVLDANLPQGYLPVANTLSIRASGEPQVQENGVHWKIDARRQIQPALAVDDLLPVLAGKSPEEARAVLLAAVRPEAPPEIRLRPAWWPRLPYLPFRIKVSVQ